MASTTKAPSGSRPGCVWGNFEEAQARCEKHGMRLCSVQEIKGGAGEASGCFFDHGLVWTSDVCADDKAADEADEMAWTGSKPDMWFIAEDYLEKQDQWPNRGQDGGAINNVVRSGRLASVVESGHGADAMVASVKGTQGTSLNFGKLIKSSKFTLCTVTRYAGRYRRRIIQGGGNWLFGHWHGRAGVSYTHGWATGYHNNIKPVDDWVVMCGQAGKVLANGRSVGNGRVWRMPHHGGVVVNRGDFGARGLRERSDFEIAEIMVWNSQIADMDEASQYLLDVLAKGRMPAKVGDGFVYQGCLFHPRGWQRPGGDVSISADGAEQCNEICGSRGFKFFGLECPMGSKVHCQCSNGLAGISSDEKVCKGQK